MKKNLKSKDALIYVKVDYTSHCDITIEADPNEEYDGDDIQYSHLFNGYKIVNLSEYWDFIFENLNLKHPLYLVYVLHTDGDSFHYESGKICMVALVESMEDAILIKDKIEKNSEKDEGVILKIKLSTGKELTIGTSTWMGYFERFESVNIEKLNYIKA